MMFASIKNALSALSFPSFPFFPRTMDTSDAYIQHLLNPSYVTLPDAMLFYYTQSVIHSWDPVLQALERVMVESGTISKDLNPLQHEFVILKIILEHTVGDVEPKPPVPKDGEASELNDKEPTEVINEFVIKTFFQHPKSKQFLKVIQQNIQDSPSASVAIAGTTLVLAFALVSSSMLASPFTLASPSALGSASTVGLASALGSAAYFSVKNRESSSSPLLPLTNPGLAPQPEQLSYTNKASPRLVQSLVTYTSSNNNTPAENRFLGKNFLKTKGLGMGHNAWTHTSNELNLLALILLVCIVHQEHPIIWSLVTSATGLPISLFLPFSYSFLPTIQSWTPRPLGKKQVWFLCHSPIRLEAKCLAVFRVSKLVLLRTLY